MDDVRWEIFSNLLKVRIALQPSESTCCRFMQCLNVLANECEEKNDECFHLYRERETLPKLRNVPGDIFAELLFNVEVTFIVYLVHHFSTSFSSNQTYSACWIARVHYITSVWCDMHAEDHHSVCSTRKFPLKDHLITNFKTLF